MSNQTTHIFHNLADFIIHYTFYNLNLNYSFIQRILSATHIFKHSFKYEYKYILKMLLNYQYSALDL